MSYTPPEPGRYRRIKDGAAVQVFGCSGTSALASVTVKASTKGSRIVYVRLENFWKKYEPFADEAGESPTVNEVSASENLAAADRQVAPTSTTEVEPADDFRPVQGPTLAALHRKWLDRGLPAHTWAAWVREFNAAQQDRESPAVAS